MKRGILFGSLFLLFVLVIPFIYAEGITGETITGEATTQQVNMQIYVQLTLPYLSLISPDNLTYRSNESILINYTVQNEDFVWYNFDNGQNITISSPTYVNLSDGSHTLYIFANNTNGLKTSSVSFIANSSKLIILYGEFKDKGETYDFDPLTYESLSSVGNVVLDNPNYGKIEFRNAINILQGLSEGENVVNLDSNVEISDNLIYLNPNTLPGLNKSSTLYLYNLSFDNPRILKNGEVCPSPYCVIQSYSGGNLEFDVNSFSTYSAQETPEGEGDDEGDSSGGGSGGGGIFDFIEEDLIDDSTSYFDVNVEKFEIKIKQGETKQEVLKIKNKENRTLSFLIRSERMDDLLLIENSSFYLEPGEEIEVNLDFLARESVSPELYLGKIIIESEGSHKEIFVSVEIESKKALFDVKSKIPFKYKNIRAGEEIVSEIMLLNVGDVGKVDVVVEYSIRNEDNKVLIKEHDEMAVETKLEYKKVFITPENIETGNYVFYVAIFYDGEVASSSSWFSVRGKRSINWALAALYAFLLFIVFSIIRLYQLYIKEQRKERVKKYEEEEKKEEQKKKKQATKKKPDYIRIKAPKSSKKKSTKKRVNRRITPSGYLDLTKALKDQK